MIFFVLFLFFIYINIDLAAMECFSEYTVDVCCANGTRRMAPEIVDFIKKHSPHFKHLVSTGVASFFIDEISVSACDRFSDIVPYCDDKHRCQCFNYLDLLSKKELLEIILLANYFTLTDFTCFARCIYLKNFGINKKIIEPEELSPFILKGIDTRDNGIIEKKKALTWKQAKLLHKYFGNIQLNIAHNYKNSAITIEIPNAFFDEAFVILAFLEKSHWHDELLSMPSDTLLLWLERADRYNLQKFAKIVGYAYGKNLNKDCHYQIFSDDERREFFKHMFPLLQPVIARGFLSMHKKAQEALMQQTHCKIASIQLPELTIRKGKGATHETKNIIADEHAIHIVDDDGMRAGMLLSKNAITIVEKYKNTLLVGAKNGDVRVWREEPILFLQELKKHKKAITAIAYNEEHYVATAGVDKKICLWNLNSGRLLARCNIKKYCSFLAFMSKALIIGYKNQKFIELKNLVHQEKAFCFQDDMCLRGHKKHLTLLHKAPQYQVLCSGDSGGHFKIWDLKTKKIAYEWKAHEAGLTACAVDGTLKYIATGDQKGFIKIWNLKEHTCLKEMNLYDSPVRSLTFFDQDSCIKTLGCEKKIATIKKIHLNSLFENQRIMHHKLSINEACMLAMLCDDQPKQNVDYSQQWCACLIKNLPQQILDLLEIGNFLPAV